MNTRERFLSVMAFDGVAPPKWEFGYWASTLRRWYGEGLNRAAGLQEDWPNGIGVHGGAAGWRQGRPIDFDVKTSCSLDEGLQRIPLNNFVCPEFPEEILEEGEGWAMVRNGMGVVERRRNDKESVPSFVSGPVASIRDWERFKAERLNPALAGRLPDNWRELNSGYGERTYPLAIGGGQGFFGTPRYLFGDTNVLTAFYDSPELMRAIINDLAEFWIRLYDQVLNLVSVDLALVWEDMCYNRGPLISPAMFKAFLLPAYLRLTSFLKDRGVRCILVDTDGDVWKLLPLFLEAGITGLYPFEVRAGMDVVQVRRSFPTLQILGGIDKRLLLCEAADVERELTEKVPWMIGHGGYIPYVDHFVPPDVSWRAFSHYRGTLNGIIDKAAEA